MSLTRPFAQAAAVLDMANSAGVQDLLDDSARARIQEIWRRGVR